MAAVRAIASHGILYISRCIYVAQHANLSLEFVSTGTSEIDMRIDHEDQLWLNIQLFVSGSTLIDTHELGRKSGKLVCHDHGHIRNTQNSGKRERERKRERTPRTTDKEDQNVYQNVS
jgi:hypothetical protein